MIEVIALQNGMYPTGTKRAPGDKFFVETEAHVSKRWMAVKGTPRYDDFARAIPGDGPARDAITGERLSSGGIAEQLAIALEENRALTARVAEIEAELTLAREAAPAAPVASPTPAETEDPEKEQGSGDAQPARTGRRRRTRKA